MGRLARLWDAEYTPSWAFLLATELTTQVAEVTEDHHGLFDELIMRLTHLSDVLRES
jgi:hypothetical protein